MNTPIARAEPAKVNVRTDTLSRIAFTFSPARFTPGIYRVDVHVEDKPVWRSFITITD
jgi:hypothetical protein